MTLWEIVQQLASCGYECEAGRLENSIAFHELIRLATEGAVLSQRDKPLPTEARELLLEHFRYLISLIEEGCVVTE